MPRLLRLFGASRFREGQLEVIMAAMRGESLLAVRPTGSGKSLCFQLPAIALGGTAVVLCPLKALMKEQVTDLHKLGIPATFLNSDITGAERTQRLDLLDEGAWALFYCTPERFDIELIRDPTDIERIASIKPSLLVVDESHLVEVWGTDFRPAYGRLAEIRQRLGNPPILAFTATAGRSIQLRILDSMGIPDATVFVSGVDRPNISLIRKPISDDEEGFGAIKRLLSGVRGRVMIFAPTLKEGRKIQDGLSAQGVPLPFYHGKLPRLEREELAARFVGRSEPRVDAVICTNAFGMGLDISNVRLVVHWQQPESVEDYLQEFGRAGRDGKPSLAVIFDRYNGAGLRNWMADRMKEEAVRKGVPRQQAEEVHTIRRGRIDSLRRMIDDRNRCFRREILRYFEGDQPQGSRSFVMRMLQWIFGARARTQRAHFCCDKCDPRAAEAALAGQFPGFNST